MSSKDLLRLLGDINKEYLYSKWGVLNYRNYMNSLIDTNNTKGCDFIYNCFQKNKIPFVVFRSKDNFFYIDKYSRFIDVHKLDKNLNIINSYNLGYKSSLSFILETIKKRV